MALACVVGNVSAANAQWQPSGGIPNVDEMGWWRWLNCYFTSPTNQACQQLNTKVHAKRPTNITGGCCGGGPIVINVGQTYETQGTLSLTLPGCGGVGSQTFSYSRKQSRVASSTLTYKVPPCGCVSFVQHEYYRFQETRQLQTTDFCVDSDQYLGITFRPINSWVNWREIIPLPVGPIEPHYYDPPSSCGSNCVDSTPADNDHPWPHPIVDTQPPKPEIIDSRPWDPALDGALLLSALEPSSVQVDLTSWFADRHIKGVLDLQLTEIRYIVGVLEQPPASIVDTRMNARVQVILDDDNQLGGIRGDLISSLKSSAKMLLQSSSYGDFNGDGYRDDVDMDILADMLMNPPDVSIGRRYDLDGDNFLSSNDLTVLVQLIQQ